MNRLTNCEPRKVFAFFEQICAIPHGSGNTGKIAEFCVNFAKERSLRCLCDDANNVVIFKQASRGYENAPTIILQGHLDMVCAKTPDNPINMSHDGLQVTTDGDWIHAINTSLGGDNGIAVAMALAILDDDTLAHPALEIVLTSDEEIGMNGAVALDATPIKGRRMINMDSEEEGVFTVSCAGGVCVEGILPIVRKPYFGMRCTVTVNGLLGGHSGVEIHKGRGNAIKLLGRVLFALQQQLSFGIVSLNGGVVDNAIPFEARAEIVLDPNHMSVFTNIVEKTGLIFQHEYATTDAKVSVTWSEEGPEQAFATDLLSTQRTVFILMNAPCGVQVMSPDIPDLVQTSLNLGVIELTKQELRTKCSVRSSVETQKQLLKDQLWCLFDGIGGSVLYSNEYPGWAYRKDSPLRDLAVQSYRNLYGAEPRIIAIHAGLECGLFADKLPELDCLSLGPNMKDIHTVNERLSISSTARTFQLVLDILKNTHA